MAHPVPVSYTRRDGSPGCAAVFAAPLGRPLDQKNNAEMKTKRSLTLALFAAALCAAATPAVADETSTDSLGASGVNTRSETPEQAWNWHAQNTDIVQYHPGFPASYSGPNSLAARLRSRKPCRWICMPGRACGAGAEAHVDGLMWQGFGLSKTLGVEGFPERRSLPPGHRRAQREHRAPVHSPDHRPGRRAGNGRGRPAATGRPAGRVAGHADVGEDERQGYL